MSSYRLYDISFQRRDDKIDIKLYFQGDGEARRREEEDDLDAGPVTAGAQAAKSDAET